jgi:hypothetical protein
MSLARWRDLRFGGSDSQNAVAAEVWSRELCKPVLAQGEGFPCWTPNEH